MNEEWFEDGPYTFFDLETTGMSPTRDRIVEIAAIRYGSGGAESRFHSLVNPGRHICGKSSSVHGITDAMLEDAPRFREVGPKFLEFAENSTLVAHNARFDLGFLQESLLRNSLGIWNGLTLDSMKFLKTVFPGLPAYNLRYLTEHFGMRYRDGKAHRAMNDVEITVEIFKMTMGKIITKAKLNPQ